MGARFARPARRLRPRGRAARARGRCRPARRRRGRRARPRAARRGGRRDGGAGGRRAHARGALAPPSRPLELSATERDGVWAGRDLARHRASRSCATPARASCFMHELSYERGHENVPSAALAAGRERLVGRPARPRRRCRAARARSRPAPCPRSTSSRRRVASGSSRSCGSPTTTTQRARVAPMVITIAVLRAARARLLLRRRQDLARRERVRRRRPARRSGRSATSCGAAQGVRSRCSASAR